jgi:outer membrane protein assembly factor BamA
LGKRDYIIGEKAVSAATFLGERIRAPRAAAIAMFFAVCAFAAIDVSGQNRFEGRTIANIAIVYDGSDKDTSPSEVFRSVVTDALGPTYSTVRIRDSIEALHKTGLIVSVVVQAEESGPDAVNLRYVVKRQTQAGRVNVEIGNTVGDEVTEQEILFRLNLLDPGTVINEQALRNNADLILEYLRDRGFYNAEVTYTQTPIGQENTVAVTFRVVPGTQSHVVSFAINIQGFDTAKLLAAVKLKPGELFTRDKLNKDVEKIRDVLRSEDFLAPELSEPRVVLDPEKNAVTIEVTGNVGPKVNVSVEAEGEKVGSNTQKQLLPVKRDGTLDYAAIVEGERRLEDFFQRRGYFFVDVSPVCSVEPPFKEGEASAVTNNTEYLCSALGGAELMNRTVDLKYQVALNRKFTLTEIRIKGTNAITIDDVSTILESQTQNLLSYIPYLGYGRGYTSQAILDRDASTLRSLMRELGYRQAQVRVNQGVSPTSDDLIITFVIEEGPKTTISDVEIAGNKAIPTDQLLQQLPSLTGRNYSRARIRNGERALQQFYSEQGYYDAHVTSSIIEDPASATPESDTVKLVFTVDKEGKKVIINRIMVTGNQDTKTSAIVKALTLHPSEPLRARDIYTSEQNLYSSDVFSNVEIKPQPAGDGANGTRLSDLIVSVTEQPPRLIQYGGGFSTDLGLNGFVDIRHFNLFGRLWQGGARLRLSQRQQLAQIDFINPRFLRDGKDRFAPLTLSAQYQRDSTVTRFFRSAFDRGTFGIVQRIDENGNPIDEFGNKTGSPTLNRFTLTAETNRTINRAQRSVVFFRYRFEDVRLFNIESLLIRDLLIPDSRTRISGFGATFVRDTRERCEIKFSLLEIIAKGDPGNPCRYNASDPTRGDYLTAEFNVSLPILGANIGFNKFQASYNYFYSFPKLRNTTLAARAILGFANVFSGGDRFDETQFPGLNGILPISERFFAGGANTLRGFDFEEAGPRVVVVPQGTFRNSSGEIVTLNPFTIPFGGNALAVVNLEARVPLTTSIRAVPFYDGGNVFRRVGDIFNPPDVPANDAFRQNLRALWTHTVGLGFRVKTPVGGELGVDFGYLLNPPRFVLGPNQIYQLRREQIHFRFSQAF